MAHIARITNKLVAPQVRLTGYKYAYKNRPDGLGILKNETLVYGTYSFIGDTTKKSKKIRHTSFAKRHIAVFNNEVIVNIVEAGLTIDPQYHKNIRKYRRHKSYINPLFIGVLRTHVNPRDYYSITYYTLNGKDPTRTDSSIWKGKPLVIKNNIISSDNIVFKAKSYHNGVESEVTKVEFRIVVGRKIPRSHYEFNNLKDKYVRLNN
jgi:hypothetical protein